MPTHPIGERPMTSGERSARLAMKNRIALAEIRNTLNRSTEMLLKAGHVVAANVSKQDAFEYFRQAEIHANHVQYLNSKLEPFEREIQAEGFPERKGFETHRASGNLVITKNISEFGMTAEDRQAAYEASRASRRPEINARYGHLAKAPRNDE